ncbi:choice-of-anchor D domain-containing protein [Xanthomarina sp. F1114]|uniref:choice-of-anchor D domain-containing protein n=1 Tax=Xanthomarina sp. F1114 TaxID=2996019 RepID=UPI00225E1F9C|nr:choice-of-anchor D domain-containing protein [Xanthomarina sp. F1114]MCX7546434.1 choice-of-anchor D domain-containing protein [Xanthomarina sp. F1114]
MIKKYSLIFAALLCFGLSGFGQEIDINVLNIDYNTNFNSWNGTLPNGYTHTGEITTYRGDQADTDSGGLYAVPNNGYGYQPSGSADHLTLTATYRNTSGSPITELVISYEAFSIYHQASRLPGWSVTSVLGNVSSLDWSYNQSATNNIPDLRTVTLTGLNIANNATFTIDFDSDRGSGSGRSPKIGLNNIRVNANNSAPTTPELQIVDNTATNQNCGYTIDFGTLGSNFGTNNLTFDIENLGFAELDVSSLNITGTNAGDFSIVSPAAPFTVIPGASQTVTVQFAPTANGTRNGVLTINNNDVDESSCTVNLTGIGVTPDPEIRVETNSGNNIPDAAGIAPVYDNTFAGTIEGQTSAPKTYLIVNLGTGPLDLSSITVSTTEFIITSNPAPISLAPGDSTPVMIAFSPSTPGEKNATVTINNNDSNENPFTFAVRGTGICGSSSMTSTPSSGPIGTVITLTDFSTNISTATVTLNGTPLTVSVISNHEIEVTVPTGAQTGNLIVTNSLGCSSAFAFSIIDSQIGGCEGSATLADIFISEITDATLGGLTYIELYNGTGSPVNLSGYSIGIYNNGENSPSNSVNLTGNILTNDTFVIAIGATTNPQTSNSCPINGNGELADLVSNVGGINKKTNEHDAIRLLKASGTVVVDEFGVHESNNWMDSMHTTVSGDRGFNFRRLNTASPLPNNNFDDNDWLIIDWAGSGTSSCNTNDYSDIGTYDFSTGVPPSITVQPNLPASYCDLTASISVTATEGFVGGNPLAYQWYYSAPGDTGWTEVINGTNYAGANSDTLTILDVLNLENYQFYCQVREDTASCYQASNAVRLYIERTIWTATGWSSPPTIDKIAIIDADYNTGNGTNGQVSFEACNLIVNSGNTLIISGGTYVDVNLNITNNGALHIENNGSLVQRDNAGINTGNISMDRDTNIRRLDYVYWSSPITGFNVNNISPGSPSNRIYRWHPTIYNTNGTQGNWVAAAGETMQAGIGYIVRGPSSYTDTPQIYTATFNNGAPFNGVITVPVSRGTISGNIDDQWNLIGNPYPSAIDAFSFLQHPNNSELDGYVHLWTHGHNISETYIDPFYDDFGYNYTETDYLPYNATGSGSGPGDFYIGAGQSFMVNLEESEPENSTIEFTNSMRNSTYDNSHFYRTTERNYNTAEKHRIWLDLVSETQGANRILVGYIDGATMEKDRMYDARTSIKDNQHLYSLLENKPFIIQGRALPFTDTDVVPLGIHIIEQGNYHIAIAHIDGLFKTTDQIIYLKDNLLGFVHALNDMPYSFTSEVGEFNNRFEILFKDSALSINENEITGSSISIIELQNGNIQFSVPGNYEIESVEIIDMLGRTIYKLKGKSSSEVYNLSNLSQGTYTAKITLSNGQIISKKAIKRF